jgi:hypothetical protein
MSTHLPHIHDMIFDTNRQNFHKKQQLALKSLQKPRFLCNIKITKRNFNITSAVMACFRTIFIAGGFFWPE